MKNPSLECTHVVDAPNTWRLALNIHKPIAYFNAEFFNHPIMGFTVMWPDKPHCHVVTNGQPCHWDCMEGVIVKGPEGQIWVLNGNYDFKRDLYEGAWPD